MNNSNKPLVDRIIAANKEIPASGCRAQHARHGGHHRATFRVHEPVEAHSQLSEGLFSQPKDYEALVRYSNGKEQDASQPDAHGLAIKIFADDGDRLLTDPDNGQAIDFILVDVDTFFSDDLADYTTVNEQLVPLLQKKQKDQDQFSFWEALGGLLAVAFSLRTIDDAIRLFRFRGEKEPVGGIARWDLRYSSATPYQLGDVGPVKYIVKPATTAPTDDGIVAVEFCIQLPRENMKVDIESPSQSWEKIADIVPIATLLIDGTDGVSGVDVERLRFNPWHVPPEHAPLGAINLARRDVYSALADKRRSEVV